MKTVLTLLCLIVSTALFAQQQTSATGQAPEEGAVRQTIARFFTGMNQADTLMIKGTLMDGVRLQTVVNKAGQVSIKEDNISKFIGSVGKAKPGSLDERLGLYEVKTDGDLATAFTPYAFYYNGQQSHCGANAFTLVRTGGNWKIQHIIDTRRQCP